MLIESVRSIFGEELMIGTTEPEVDEVSDREELRERFPEVYHFVPALSSLEREFASSVTVEFAASARIYFSTGAALTAKRRRGERVCFCKPRFVPADTVVMSEMDMILSLTPAAIHVVTACRASGSRPS